MVRFRIILCTTFSLSGYWLRVKPTYPLSVNHVAGSHVPERDLEESSKGERLTTLQVQTFKLRARCIGAEEWRKEAQPP